MSQLHRVLYCSRNRIPGNKEAVAGGIRDILAISRENNARAGVTGGLLFTQGCFAQVLEGPLDAIEATFERIQCDERHSDVTVLQSMPIAARDFSDWSMAFAGTENTGDALSPISFAEFFSGRSSGGGAVLELLRAVVRRETQWLAAS